MPGACFVLKPQISLPIRTASFPKRRNRLCGPAAGSAPCPAKGPDTAPANRTEFPDGSSVRLPHV